MQNVAVIAQHRFGAEQPRDQQPAQKAEGEELVGPALSGDKAGIFGAQALVQRRLDAHRAGFAQLFNQRRREMLGVPHEDQLKALASGLSELPKMAGILDQPCHAAQPGKGVRVFLGLWRQIVHADVDHVSSQDVAARAAAAPGLPE